MDRMEGAAGPARHGGRDQDRVANVLASVENRKFTAARVNTFRGDPVGAYLDGERQAQHLVERLRSQHVDADELFRTVRRLVQVGTDEQLRGFCRAAQKVLESAR